MMARVFLLATGAWLAGTAALAQSTTTGTTTTNSGTSVADAIEFGAMATRPPAENVRAGAVAQRAPSAVISAARARHAALRATRIEFQATAGGERDVTTGTTSTSSNSLSSLLSGVLGSTGLSSLAGLDINTLTSLLGSATGTTGTTGTGMSGSTTNSNIPSNLTPDVIAALSAAGINVNDLYPPSGTSTTTGSSGRSKSSSSGDKVDSRSQTTTTQPSFAVRWANAMLSTLFTGIVVGMQTPDFIDLLANNLRPILRPETRNGE